MRGWLRKIPTGARRLQLTAEDGAGLNVVTEWSREDVENADDASDITKAIIAAAQEHAHDAGEEVKFLLRWIGSRERILKTTTHHATPAATDDDAPPTMEEKLSATDMVARMNSELVKHLAERERLSNDERRTQMAAYKDVISLLTEQLKEAHKLLRKFADEEHTTPTVVELTPEQRDESAQRARALSVFVDQIPKVVEMGLNAAAMKFLPPASGAAETPKQKLKVVPDK